MRKLISVVREELMGNVPEILGSLFETLLRFEPAQVRREVNQHCEYQRPHRHMEPSSKLLPDPFGPSIPQLQSAFVGLPF